MTPNHSSTCNELYEKETDAYLTVPDNAICQEVGVRRNFLKIGNFKDQGERVLLEASATASILTEGNQNRTLHDPQSTDIVVI
jgi:hypothetical protein